MRGADRRHVDDLALAFGVLHHEIEIVGAGRALLVEGAAAIGGVVLDEAEAAGERRHPLGERGMRRDRIDDAAGVGALRLHPRLRFGTHLLHVAVIVGDLPAEEGLAHRLGGRRRRLRRPADGRQRIGSVRGERHRKGERAACAEHDSSEFHGGLPTRFLRAD